MTTDRVEGQPGGDDLAALDRAIAALEAQRAVLGDDVVETALAPLRERRTALVDRPPGEQRKLVTVVFADLVGFTDLSGWLDPEDTRSIVDTYFARWRRVIEAHGGVVEKFIGDAVMAVFGLHRSWEDDAQRAVRSALAMVTDLAKLNEELERQHRLSLRMRVGIDTGDVVVSTLGARGARGDDDFVAVGPTVNRAARLQAAAPPDRVLVSAETRRQLRGRFSLERIGALVLKGFDEPVDAFLVVSERPRGYHLDRSGGVEGVETTTVGRESELRLLQDRLWDVVEEGRWRVVTVLGDAGVGKSRLLLDFDEWLAEQPQSVYWFRGRAAHSGKNHANALLRDLVASRFGVTESDDPGTVRTKLETGFARAMSDEAAHRTAHLVGPWLGLDVGTGTSMIPSDPQALRDSATEALGEYFAALARVHPVVVLLEDLHWADDGSLRWLDAADSVLHDSRVLVVATARPTLLEERPRWSEGLGHHVRVALSPLSRRQSRLLLQQILRQLPDPPEALVDLVIDSADGNPFYIEELVTWLLDAGVIVRGDPSWHVVDELVGSVVVPSTLRGVLQARLDALSQAERAVLQRASVVGRVFWDEAVLRLDGSPRSGDTTDALDDLRRRELVFEREVSAFDAAREFLFKHALLRDVAYDGVLRAHRRRYHRLAGAWLAEVSARSGREDEYAALVAEHLDRAGEPAAAEWYLRAGRQALAVFALGEATRLLDRALALVTDDPALRFDVLAVRETVLDRLGDRDAQRLDVIEMESLTERRPDDLPRLAQYQLARSRQAFELSEYAEAEEWAEATLRTAEAAGLPERAAEAFLWRGKSQTWRDEADGARTSLRQAIDRGRAAGRPQVEAEALRYLSIVANNEGDYTEALQRVAEAREAFRRDGDLEGEGTAMAQQSTTLFNAGRVREAKAMLEQVLPMFRRSGHRYREAVVLGNLATIAHSQGELARALEWGRAAADITRALNDREALTNHLLVLGVAATSAGRWDEAAAQLAEAVDLSREVEARTNETDALSRSALMHVERGAVEQALPLAREAVAVGELAQSALERGHAQVILGYAELAAGHTTAAAESFRAAEESFADLDVDMLAREARVGRAAVLLACGRTPDAVRLVEEVRPYLDRDGLEGCERPTAVWETCWRVLRGVGHPDAGAVLAAAQEYLRETADLIGDAALAQGYLEVPLNARLLAARP